MKLSRKAKRVLQQGLYTGGIALVATLTTAYADQNFNLQELQNVLFSTLIGFVSGILAASAAITGGTRHKSLGVLAVIIFFPFTRGNTATSNSNPHPPNWRFSSHSLIAEFGDA